MIGAQGRGIEQAGPCHAGRTNDQELQHKFSRCGFTRACTATLRGGCRGGRGPAHASRRDRKAMRMADDIKWAGSDRRRMGGGQQKSATSA